MIELLQSLGLPALSIVILILLVYPLRKSVDHLFTQAQIDLKSAHDHTLTELERNHALELQKLEQQHEQDLQLRQQKLMDRYEAVKEIRKYQYELDHSLMRERQGENRQARIRQLSGEMREVSRKHAEVFGGKSIIQAVLELTEVVTEASETKTIDSTRLGPVTNRLESILDEISSTLPGPSR